MKHGAATVLVTVKPGAKAPGLVRAPDGTLVVRVREPAIDGRANEAARNALADLYRVPKSAIALIRGARSRRKIFAIEGVRQPQRRP